MKQNLPEKTHFNETEAIKIYKDKKPYCLYLELIKDIIESDVSDYAKAIVLVYGPHQKRIPYHIKDKWVDRIEKQRLWENKYHVFENIFEDILKQIHPSQARIAPYDIALRLGYSLGIEPKEFVYITSEHVQKNARTLLGIKGKVEIKYPVSIFPLWIRELQPYEIEDFLCHVDKFIKNGDNWDIIFKNLSHRYSDYYPQSVREEISKIKDGKYAELMGYSKNKK